MKAISVKNPWAYLICSGKKDIENRSWQTRYRGRLLIHASAQWDSEGPPLDIFINPPCSAIIGLVEVADCIQNSPSPWAEEGLWHWVLKNPVMFEKPIRNIKGNLSLWGFPIEQYSQIKVI
jgi:hypothetical protein